MTCLTNQAVQSWRLNAQEINSLHGQLLVSVDIQPYPEQIIPSAWYSIPPLKPLFSIGLIHLGSVVGVRLWGWDVCNGVQNYPQLFLPSVPPISTSESFDSAKKTDTISIIHYHHQIYGVMMDTVSSMIPSKNSWYLWYLNFSYRVMTLKLIPSSIFTSQKFCCHSRTERGVELRNEICQLFEPNFS